MKRLPPQVVRIPQFRIRWVLLFGALAFLTLALWPVPALLVQDLDEPGVVGIFPLRPGEILSLRYRHSRYGGWVWEHFQAGANGLVLTGLEAEQEAALEYYGLPQRIRYRAGRAAIEGLRVSVGEVVVRATSLGERTLVVGGRAIPLAAGREGHRIQLRVVSLPRLRLAWNRFQVRGKER
ncbi:MAG: hypothetical protein N0A24_09470 [Armatimonadetes bacterium]|nr:hypothetical protein [Armatimonadota bacterium]MDW8154412.1 hypothetical protein [Armatimonadota bacterium]